MGRRRRSVWIWGPLLLLLAASPAGAVPSAEEIVKRADLVRTPPGNFFLDVRITSFAPGRPRRVAVYRVLVKDFNRSVVQVLSPPRERGRILLLRGNNLWLFLPRLQQPVRISLQQRLMGDVANGDLARTNFSGDYRAVLLGTERVNGRPAYRLELTAARRGVTYHRIHYWVERGTYRPLRAAFYAISGHLLKVCAFEDYRWVLGRKRPMRLVIADALVRGQRSVMEYLRMQARVFPDKLFTKEYLSRLQE